MEVELDDRIVTLNLASLIKLQARWRAAVVRKHIRATRDEFTALFHDIEGHQKLSVTFPSALDLVNKPRVNLSRQPSTQNLSAAESTRSQPEANHTNNATKTATDVDYSDDFESCSQSSSRTVSIPEEISLRDHVSDSDQSAVGVHELPTSDKHDEHVADDVGDLEGSDRTISESNSVRSRGSPTRDNSYSVQPDDVKSNQEQESNSDTVSEKQDSDPVLVATPEVSEAEAASSVEQVSEERNVESRKTNQTSIWDSTDIPLPTDSSPGLKQDSSSPVSLNREELTSQRNNIVMELLWVQQAINSRKQYLKMKASSTAMR